MLEPTRLRSFQPVAVKKATRFQILTPRLLCNSEYLCDLTARPAKAIRLPCMCFIPRLCNGEATKGSSQTLTELFKIP